ncbi:hypothetical protein [Actinomadura macrotermitis]|uniref:Uncharacterized protein n=1 Tax=Actinomadura macrotermitis TaxID=2585200 RepID=A0A7K0BRV4_9ACTN|nr:hypothetical protein [Actinomadura macrotermitis]MQY03434.1 hypothetical protein [Actinomadura macrotermitis]
MAKCKHCGSKKLIEYGDWMDRGPHRTPMMMANPANWIRSGASIAEDLGRMASGREVTLPAIVEYCKSCHGWTIECGECDKRWAADKRPKMGKFIHCPRCGERLSN